MIEIDGSEGEGGGQVLRTSLALSVVTGQPFRLFNIRAKRSNPGLQRQHLTCVQAARDISGAETTGAAIGSRDLTFTPGPVRAGRYRFAVGTAGSASLVLQTVLPPLLHADAASDLTLEGGTHNAWAPPFDFLARAFVPLLRFMGAPLSVGLERYGFYPKGGGVLNARIGPWHDKRLLSLQTRPESPEWWVNATLCALPDHIGVREIRVARDRFDIPRKRSVLNRIEALGEGNVVAMFADCSAAADIRPEYMEVFTGFGKRGVRAEKVAKSACDEAERWLNAGVPVGEHLADQLLIPMALGAGGRFRTVEPSGHTRTNIETIRRFLDVAIEVEEADGAWEIRVNP
jgi:RNA 3'-terminal phosphate cyclase (ATP)